MSFISKGLKLAWSPLFLTNSCLISFLIALQSSSINGARISNLLLLLLIRVLVIFQLPAGWYLYLLIGGLDKKQLCPVDYRTDLQEAKARVDLPFYRAILDEFSFSLDLLLHAIGSQLRETGTLLYFSLCSVYWVKFLHPTYRQLFHIGAAATRIALGVRGVEERTAHWVRHRLRGPRRRAAAPPLRQCGGHSISHQFYFWWARVTIHTTDKRRAGQRVRRVHVCHTLRCAHSVRPPRRAQQLLRAPPAVPNLPLGDSGGGGRSPIYGLNSIWHHIIRTTTHTYYTSIQNITIFNLKVCCFGYFGERTCWPLIVQTCKLISKRRSH